MDNTKEVKRLKEHQTQLEKSTQKQRETAEKVLNNFVELSKKQVICGFCCGWGHKFEECTSVNIYGDMAMRLPSFRTFVENYFAKRFKIAIKFKYEDEAYPDWGSGGHN